MTSGLNDNESLAQQLCEQRVWNGRRIALGDFVAIADGRVLGIGTSFDQADSYLQDAGVAAGKGMICEVTELEADIIR
jgi:hypothetical protein